MTDTAGRVDVSRGRAVLAAADTDMERYFAYFADDVTWFLGNGPVLRSVEEIRRYCDEFLDGVVSNRHDVQAAWETDDASLLASDVTYVLADGSEVIARAVTVIKWSGEKISSYEIFMDPSPVNARN